MQGYNVNTVAFIHLIFALEKKNGKIEYAQGKSQYFYTCGWWGDWVSNPNKNSFRIQIAAST